VWREGRQQGADALAFLFGAPAAADAIAGQASLFTGIRREKLDELMPALAAMAFGGLAEQARAANPAFDAMLQALGGGAAEKSKSEKGPLDRYEEEQARRESAAGGAADLARMQSEMMKTGLAAFQAGAAAWQRTAGAMTGGAPADHGEQPQADVSGRAVFGELLEAGSRIGEAYQREMEALVERLRSEEKRR
jgi:hypothetical protein